MMTDNESRDGDSSEHDWLKQGSTSSEDVEKSYDQWADSYDETLATWDYRSPGDAAGLLRGQVAPSSDILDAGCGTGLTGAALRAAGFTGAIDGLDLSQSSLDEAAKHDVYGTLRQANFQELPLDIPADTYDALFCIGVLTYVPESDAILTEFARLVRQGGTVLVSMRDDLFLERQFGDIVRGLTDTGIFRDFNISEPHPYLPGNPEFGDAIKVFYISLSVV